MNCSSRLGLRPLAGGGGTASSGAPGRQTRRRGSRTSRGRPRRPTGAPAPTAASAAASDPLLVDQMLRARAAGEGVASWLWLWLWQLRPRGGPRGQNPHGVGRRCREGVAAGAAAGIPHGSRAGDGLSRSTAATAFDACAASALLAQVECADGASEASVAPWQGRLVFPSPHLPCWRGAAHTRTAIGSEVSRRWARACASRAGSVATLAHGGAVRIVSSHNDDDGEEEQGRARR